jgi:hypothetical protein
MQRVKPIRRPQLRLLFDTLGLVPCIGGIELRIDVTLMR